MEMRCALDPVHAADLTGLIAAIRTLPSTYCSGNCLQLRRNGRGHLLHHPSSMRQMKRPDLRSESARQCMSNDQQKTMHFCMLTFWLRRDVTWARKRGTRMPQVDSRNARTTGCTPPVSAHRLTRPDGFRESRRRAAQGCSRLF